ncbi:unnamed protein product, partial [Brassica rapa subsp. narinosa]
REGAIRASFPSQNFGIIDEIVLYILMVKGFLWFKIPMHHSLLMTYLQKTDTQKD